MASLHLQRTSDSVTVSIREPFANVEKLRTVANQREAHGTGDELSTEEIEEYYR